MFANSNLYRWNKGWPIIIYTRRLAPFGRLSARKKIREKKSRNFFFAKSNFFFRRITSLWYLDYAYKVSSKSAQPFRRSSWDRHTDSQTFFIIRIPSFNARSTWKNPNLDWFPEKYQIFDFLHFREIFSNKFLHRMFLRPKIIWFISKHRQILPTSFSRNIFTIL